MKKWCILSFLFLFELVAWAQTYTLCDKWVDCGNSCQLLDPYYSEGVTFTWSGASKNGKAEGIGVAKKYKNGLLESTYEGEYHNGIREGKGKFTHIDGSVKEGNFVDGQMMGQGKFTDANGNMYVGDFVNYCPHGEGKLTIGNGSTFEGFFVSWMPYTGKWTTYDGKETYLQAGEVVDKIKEKKSKYSPELGVRQIEYFDEDWDRCNAKDAAYYRHVTYKAPHVPDGMVKDYYITGELQSTFTAVYMDYDEDGKNFHEGEALWYYKSGAISQRTYYLNNRPNGPETFYYETGTVYSVTNYNYGVKDGEAISYNSDGTVSAYCIYDKGHLKDDKGIGFFGDVPMFIHYMNFEDNEDYWSYWGANGTVKTESGNFLIMSATPGRSVSTGIDTRFLTNGVTAISFVSNRTSEDGNVISLIWGWKDWNNYNEFAICGDQFRYWSFVHGQDVVGGEWEGCPYISFVDNTMSVIIDNITDQGVILMINGEAVAVEEDLPNIGTFGLIQITNINEDEKGENVSPVIISDYNFIEVASQDEAVEYAQSATAVDEWASSGSGFFISTDGYIATNYHVIDDANVIEVSFLRNGIGESHAATVVQGDQQNDLAILKISDDFKSMDPLPYNFSSVTKETGCEVFTLGYPYGSLLGDEVKFTDGKISSKTGIMGDVRQYQISVPVQPGNSGGPLFDYKGNIVGITSSRLNKDMFGSENVNYAIKLIYLQSLVDVLPVHIDLQQSASVTDKSLTEKIDIFKDYIVFIKVK